ncbi:MAG: FUN14 domain-containing protein [bacterium]
MEAAIYFGSGFAIGFLFKKYFKFVLLTLVASIILIKILEYNMVLEIDWEGMNVLMGFDSAADFNAIVNDIFSWIKNNFIIFISSVVGFLVGYKLG